MRVVFPNTWFLFFNESNKGTLEHGEKAITSIIHGGSWFLGVLEADNSMEGITPPQPIDMRASDLAGEWRKWQMAFTDYLLAINVVKDDKAVEKRKLALLRHCGGEDLREMYSQMEFKNSDSGAEIEEGTDGRKLKDVLQRFHDHCNPRSGIVVSRCKFHNISQNGESIDVYLMKLRRLAQSCD